MAKTAGKTSKLLKLEQVTDFRRRTVGSSEWFADNDVDFVCILA